MKNLFMAFLMTLSAPAFAGYSNVTCTTSIKDIAINMENEEAPRILFSTTSDGQPVTYDYPLNMMPDLNWSKAKNAILAVPFTNKTYFTKIHQTQRLTHKDGTWCEGRQRWNEVYQQGFVLAAKGGEYLSRLAPTTLGKYMTEDMYFVTTITCHKEGLTSSGGCYGQEGDIETWTDDYSGN